MLTETEKKISRLIQQDIDLEKRPFKDIAEKLGASEEEVLATIRGLMTKGVIRKFGAILRHQKAGFSHNAMVIWAVPQERIEFAGQDPGILQRGNTLLRKNPAFRRKVQRLHDGSFRGGESGKCNSETLAKDGDQRL